MMLKTFHTSAEAWGAVFCIIAVICIAATANLGKRKKISLMLIELDTAIMLAADCLAWEFRGNIENIGYYMVRISNFLVFFTSAALIVIFHSFLVQNIYSGKKAVKEKVATYAGYLLGAVAMLLVIISQFTDLYYYFDESNVYHRTSGWIVSMLLPILAIFLDVALLLINRKKVSKLFFFALIVYSFLPFAGTITVWLNYGVSYANFANAIAAIMLFIVVMFDQSRTLIKKEKEANDLRLKLVLSQVNPHFVYNTLNTIAYLCDKNPQGAKETVQEFSGYLRGNLDTIMSEKLIPFTQEIEHLKNYLAIEQKRFGDSINVEYDIRVDGFLLPALTVQPLVENAVKHGINGKREGGTIRIATEKTDSGILITVSDDGRGFDAANIGGGNHFGIMSVRSRVENQCGGTLSVQSVPGKGTNVEILLPQR